MAIYKVTGKAKYEYDIEADSEQDAIEQASEQFNKDAMLDTGSPADVLEWAATKTTK